MGASLSGGYVENGVVTCPWHAWRFRLADGAWADNPRIKIGCYPVRVAGRRHAGRDARPGAETLQGGHPMSRIGLFRGAVAGAGPRPTERRRGRPEAGAARLCPSSR